MAGSQSIEARATYHLPIEITTDILLRLPMKSILRCKSVCKHWYDLIKTPHFIAKHLQTQSTLNSAALLVTTYNYETENHVMSLLSNDGSINLDFPFLRTSEKLSIAGICNGLVCIDLPRMGWVCKKFSRIGFYLVLCNPSTGQFQEIPNPKWNWFDENFDVKRVSYGFGFHPGANDYKLVRILLCFNTFSKYSIRVDLYAMSTNTWTKIDVDKLSLFFGEMNGWAEYDWVEYDDIVHIGRSSASAVLNGVFYWLADSERVGPTKQEVVMSFDMGNEVFRRIRTPECLDRIWDETFWKFVELNDKLALVVSSNEIIGRGFDVWVLNENGSSWTKQVKFGSFPRIASIMRIGEDGNNKVVGGGKNGELLVTEHKVSGELKLISCDTKTRETMDLYFGHVPFGSYVYLYAGSLLPVMQANEIVLNK